MKCASDTVNKYYFGIIADDGHAKSVDGKMDEEENNTQDDTGERNKQGNKVS